MERDIKKYRAQVFQIIGLALLAPFGRLILTISKIRIEDLSVRLLLDVIIVMLSLYLGIILIFKGEDHLR